MHSYVEQLDGLMSTALVGSVARTVGTTVSAAGFPAPVGAVAEIERQSGLPLRAEVVGFRDDLTVLYPWSELGGVPARQPRSPGSHLALAPRRFGDCWAG